MTLSVLPHSHPAQVVVTFALLFFFLLCQWFSHSVTLTVSVTLTDCWTRTWMCGYENEHYHQGCLILPHCLVFSLRLVDLCTAGYSWNVAVEQELAPSTGRLEHRQKRLGKIHVCVWFRVVRCRCQWLLYDCSTQRELLFLLLSLQLFPCARFVTHVAVSGLPVFWSCKASAFLEEDSHILNNTVRRVLFWILEQCCAEGIYFFLNSNVEKQQQQQNTLILNRAV